MTPGFHRLLRLTPVDRTATVRASTNALLGGPEGLDRDSINKQDAASAKVPTASADLPITERPHFCSIASQTPNRPAPHRGSAARREFHFERSLRDYVPQVASLDVECRFVRIGRRSASTHGDRTVTRFGHLSSVLDIQWTSMFRIGHLHPPPTRAQTGASGALKRCVTGLKTAYATPWRPCLDLRTSSSVRPGCSESSW